MRCRDVPERDHSCPMNVDRSARDLDVHLNGDFSGSCPSSTGTRTRRGKRMAATGLGPALDGCPSPACETARPGTERMSGAWGEDLHPTRRSNSSVLPTNTGPPRVELPGQAARPAWTRTTTESGASDNALASRTENPLGRLGIPRTCVTRSGPSCRFLEVVRVSLPMECDIHGRHPTVAQSADVDAATTLLSWRCESRGRASVCRGTRARRSRSVAYHAEALSCRSR